MKLRIYLTGMPGCGKSKVGRMLAERMQLPFVDLDVLIARAEGMEINRIFAGRGEAYFREQEAHWLREASAEPAFVMATGGGAPCFHGNMEYMNDEGVTVFLDVPLDDLCARLMRQGISKRPLLKHLGGEQLCRELAEKYALRLPFYSKARLIFNHPAEIRAEDRAAEIDAALRNLEKESQT